MITSLNSLVSLLALVEETRDDAFVGFLAGRRVVKDASAHLLKANGFLFVPFGLGHDFLGVSELALLIRGEIVTLEKSADAQPNLCHRPVLLMEALIFDILECGCTEFKNSLKQSLILLLRPVVALLDIEVLEVERAILKDDALAVLLDETFSHVYNVGALSDI